MSDVVLPELGIVKPVPLPSMQVLPVARIKAVVAASYGVSMVEMRSPSHYRMFAWPRQVAMYLSRELTDQSLSDIGRRFGRDHSTVCHAIKAVEKRMADDPIYRADVEALREALS